MPDGNLVALIAAQPLSTYTAAAYRHMAPKYADRPLSGEGARQLGGRWNPPGIATLYVGTDRATAIAELGRLARRGGRAPEDFLPRVMVQYDLSLSAVLDLRDPGLRDRVGLSLDAIRSDDLSPCQAVGEAARYAGREAILAPSATGDGDVLAIYLDKLAPNSALDVSKQETWERLPVSP